MTTEGSAGSVRYIPLQNPQQTTPFLGLTYRSYTPLLATISPESMGVAVAAIQAQGQTEEPIGLALARIEEDQITAQVLSLFVVGAARHQGIGKELLAHLERALLERGVIQVYGVYPSGKETTPFLERLLASQGWAPPRPRMYLFQARRGSLESILNAPWLKPTELAPEYHVFPWAEHTAEDRAAILAGVQAGRIPANLSPFNEEAQVDPYVSLGLRYRGVIYGWMICHRIAPHTVRYTALFIREDIPQKGLGFKLFAASLHRHLQSDRDFPDVSGCWGVLASNPFAEFLRRRLLPHLPDVSVSLTQEVTKHLVAFPSPKSGGID